MNLKAETLKQRTHDFFIGVIRFCRNIPPSPEAHSIVEQLLDSAGSTDSNYRAACKARSKKEFAAKVGVAAEEADELTSIFVASHKTVTRRLAEEKLRRAKRRR